MSDHGHERDMEDVGPGFIEATERTIVEGIRGYLTGLVLASLLTVASFYVVRTNLIWGPGIPAALIALAVAQIGVHLVFFLHITTGSDNTNNVLALAFGVLVVLLVVVGSLWIMRDLNGNMTMPPELMNLHMQR